MKGKCFVFLILPLCALSIPKGLAELRLPEVSSRNKPLVLQLQTGFYRSVSNYRGFGQYSGLPEGNFLQYVEMHPRIYYTPFRLPLQFELFMNNFYVMTQSSAVKRSVFRPVSAGGGFSFWHKFQSLYLGLELRGGLPLYGKIYGNFDDPQEIVVGDGAYFLEPGLYAIVRPAKFFYVYCHSAFRYRMFGPSGLLLTKLGGNFRTKHINFGLLADSSISLTWDEFSKQPNKRHDRLEKLNGGSFRFYSVNPSVVSFVPWMEFKFKPMAIKLYVNLDVTGQSHSRGLGFGLITKLKWNTRVAETDKKGTLKFNFKQNNIRDSSQESGAYFDEEEDPYVKRNLNQELKQELDSLKY